VLVLEVTAAEVAQLLSGEVASLSSDGFTLAYADGYFQATAPADSEGKVYTFTWENNTFTA